MREPPYVFLGGCVLEHADKRLPEIAGAISSPRESAPKDAWRSYLLGKVLAAQGDQLDKAEAALRSSIGLKTDFWESHFELGLLLEKARESMQAARRELETKRNLEPYRRRRRIIASPAYTIDWIDETMQRESAPLSMRR